MSDTDTPADAPVDHAAIVEQSRENVDAWISGDPKKMEWANRPDNGIPDRKPGESVYRADPTKGDDPVYATMPEAPKVEASDVSAAAAKLNAMGGAHAELFPQWEREGANPAEELGYAKAFFAKNAKDDPELVEIVNASGLGNHPKILRLMAKMGRLDAGMMGDLTVSQRYSAPSASPDAPAIPRSNGSKASLQAELTQLRRENPAGSQGYRRPEVQKRITQLNEALYGNGNIVGQGGRTG
jgi:hypothetical protein